MKMLVAAAALLAAGPAVATTVAGPQPPSRLDAPRPHRWEGHSRPFAGMSEAGRRTMMAAMWPGGAADKADHDRVRASRDRMLDLLSADRLDTAALRRAMDDEREAANAMRARRQAAMLQAVQSLSVADRKAFVADARNMRGRFEGRMKWGLRGHGGREGPPMMEPPGL